MLDLNNKDEAAFIEKMHDFNRQTGHRISFSYVVRDPDKGLTFVEMKNRPCYGELRAYGKDSTRPGDPKPGDLPRPMNVAGPGIREAVGVCIRKTSDKKETHNEYIEHLWSDNSPWKRGIGAHEFTYDKDGWIIGAVMWETDVDPTVMVSLFMYMRRSRHETYNLGYPVADKWRDLQDKLGCDANIALILVNWTVIGNDLKFTPRFNYGYFLPHRLDIKGFVTGNSRDVSNGRTWREGEDYNRPELQDVFMSEDKSAPVTSTWMADLLGRKPSGGSYYQPTPEIPFEDMKKIVTEIQTLAA